MNASRRIPVVFLDGSAVGAFRIFNPNDWHGETRRVIQSCATELAVLEYGAKGIGAMCLAAKDLCHQHFENLRRQWHTSPWNLGETVLFGQVPALHGLIEGFFSGVKSLLDLNAQLLSTEGVVGVSLDGFHRAKGVYGGAVVRALDRNAKHGKKQVATAITELISAHKELWIDEAVRARDQLIHPTLGAQQLMFELEVQDRGGSLVYVDAVPPRVGTMPINEYAPARVEDIKGFSSSLLDKLRETA